jgi:predicted DNA binding CopG/RHH family protein
MMELRENFPQPKKMAIDFTDPVSVEKALKKVTQTIEVMTAKSQEVTDPEEQHKFQKELDQLTKMQQELKLRLAQLRAK